MSQRTYLQLSLMLIVTIFGLVKFLRLTKPFKLITVIVLLSLISEIIARYLTFTPIKATFPAYHFLIPILIFFNGLVYSSFTHFNKKETKRIIIISVILALTVICRTVFFQKLSQIPAVSFSIFGVFIVIMSLLLFRKLLMTESTIPLKRIPEFWFNTGNFIFYSFLSFYFSVFEKLSNSWQAELIWMHNLIFILNLVLYISYFIALQLNSERNGTRLF